MADNSTKIILTAEDRTAATLATVKGNLGSMAQSAELASRALAGIGVTFSGAAMVAMVKGTIDAADGFNDLAQRVGIGIKELAGWTLAANQSGTSMETVARGVKSLSTYMVEHSDKLRAAGITATDANGAMVQLADLFKGMPDGVEKTALAVQLFGKAGMDMVPMLNLGSAGLAEAQEKAAEYGRKMAELAPDADKFNDQVAEMALHMKALGINVTSYVIDPLNNMAKALNDLAAGGSRAKAQLDFLADNGHPIARSMQAWSGVLGRMGFGETRSRGYTGPKDAAGLPMSEEAMFSGATDAYMAQREAGQRARGLLDKSSTASGGGAAKYKRSFDPEADFFYAVDEAQRKAARAQMDVNDKEMEAMEKKRIAMEDMAERRMETNRIESEGEEAIRESLEKTSREMERQKTMAQDLGFTFSSAFEDAIVGGKGLQSILSGLAQDVARIFVRRTLTEPLGNALSKFFKDALPAFAGGGDHMGGLRLVGENGPELEATGPARIFSASQTRDILGSGGGSSQQSIRVEVVNPPGRPAEVASASPRMDVDGMVIKVVLRDLANGGAISNAMAGQFGLNRAAGAY